MIDGGLEGRILCAREQETMQLLGQGLENDEIAETIGIEEQIVCLYVKSIKRKTGRKDRESLMQAYQEHGDCFEELVKPKCWKKQRYDRRPTDRKKKDWLADRQNEALRHLVQSGGASNAEIAGHMSVSKGTVGALLHKAALRLGVSNRIQLAVVYERKMKIFEPDPFVKPGTFYRLKSRRNEILRRLIEGEDYNEIAKNLGVTVHTVKYDLKVLRRKTNTKNNVELALAFITFQRLEPLF